MQRKVISYQQVLGEGISEEDLKVIQEENPDFLCLPEYFFVKESLNSQIQTAAQTGQNKEWLANLSRRLDCVVIGGSMVEKVQDKFYNTCFVYSKGEEVGSYRKLNPFGREATFGISPGKDLQVFELDGVRAGVLICADVLIPDIFKRMGGLKPQIIFSPTTSPFREGETVETKKRRDFEIYVAGAGDAGAYIVKTCAVGTLLSKRLQGRSLIAAPWGVIKRVDFNEEDNKAILASTLNLKILKNWREGGLGRAPANSEV
jgi:omega-amidase